MTALYGLGFSSTQIGDEGCELLAPTTLAQMTALKMFDLSYNEIGDKGCEFLAPALGQTMVRVIKSFTKAINLKKVASRDMC